MACLSLLHSCLHNIWSRCRYRVLLRSESFLYVCARDYFANSIAHASPRALQCHLLSLGGFTWFSPSPSPLAGAESIAPLSRLCSKMGVITEPSCCQDSVSLSATARHTPTCPSRPESECWEIAIVK